MILKFHRQKRSEKTPKKNDFEISIKKNGFEIRTEKKRFEKTQDKNGFKIFFAKKNDFEIKRFQKNGDAKAPPL